LFFDLRCDILLSKKKLSFFMFDITSSFKNFFIDGKKTKVYLIINVIILLSLQKLMISLNPFQIIMAKNLKFNEQLTIIKIIIVIPCFKSSNTSKPYSFFLKIINYKLDMILRLFLSVKSLLLHNFKQ
jgi:hypothetical protein